MHNIPVCVLPRLSAFSKFSFPHYPTSMSESSQPANVAILILSPRYDKNSDSYNSYGRKGIIICDDWKEYQGFESWALENGYNNHLTIDRIDVYGNYFPENCQWISFYENRKKHRNSIMLNYDGRIEPLKTWCDILGLPTQTVRRYYHKNGTHKTELGIASVIETNNRRYFNIKSKSRDAKQN